jgi:hypothetical protein
MSARFRDRWRLGAPPSYTALLDFFGGDAERADAWLAGQLAYTGDAATAEQLLTALEQFGTPNGVVLKLASVPNSALDAFDIIAETHALEGGESIPSLATSYIFTVT